MAFPWENPRLSVSHRHQVGSGLSCEGDGLLQAKQDSHAINPETPSPDVKGEVAPLLGARAAWDLDFDDFWVIFDGFL